MARCHAHEAACSFQALSDELYQARTTRQRATGANPSSSGHDTLNPAFELWSRDYPDAAAAVQHLYEATIASGVLDARTQALAYIAVLATLRYAPGIRSQIRLALDAGATRDEIRAALMVSIPAAGIVNVLAVYQEVEDLLGLPGPTDG